MINVLEDLVDYATDTWQTWRDKDKKISFEFISKILIIIMDLFDSITDIIHTWKEKDEKLLTKIVCTIITIILFITGIRIWL